MLEYYPLIIILKSFFLLIGLMCLYLAFFSFEYEQIKIQNKLEEWWIKIDDKKEIFNVRLTKFLKWVSQLTTIVINKYFGNKIFSFQSAWVAFFYIQGFSNIAFIILHIFEHIPNEMYYTILIPGFLYIFLTMLPLIIRNKNWIKWGFILLIAYYVFLLTLTYVLFNGALLHLQSLHFVDLFEMVLICFFGYLFGTVLCMSLIGFFRWIIRLISNSQSIKQLIIYLTFLIIVTIITVGSPIFIGEKLLAISEENMVITFNNYLFIELVIMSNLNIASLFPVLLLIILLVIIPINRVFWFFVSRPFYTLAQYKILANRSFMFTLAVFFIGYAIRLPMSHNDNISRTYIAENNIVDGYNKKEVISKNNDVVSEYVHYDAVEVPQENIVEDMSIYIPDQTTCHMINIFGKVYTSGAKIYMWFEWGVTLELLNSTPKWYTTKNVNFYKQIYIQPNTKYYYELVMQKEVGGKIKRGGVKSFTTSFCEE